MSFQLTNQDDPTKILRLTVHAWYGILEMADEFGWNPMGTVLPMDWIEITAPDPSLYGGYEPHDPFHPYDPEYENRSYVPDESRLVMLEDALNLADALESAFLAYEPEWVRHFYVNPLTGSLVPLTNGKPGIGAVNAVADFCRNGAFWIDRQ